MQIIKELPGSSSSKVELVEMNGTLWVLKTADPVELENERAFYSELSKAGIPTLTVLNHDLPPNQILLEYIENSTTINSYLNDNSKMEDWGKVVHLMHSIISPVATMLNGEIKQILWSAFIDQEIQEAVERQQRKEEGLSESNIKQFLNRVEPLRTQRVPQIFSLVHADLHSNNAFVHGNEVILFDKGSGIFYGDPWYDLATVATGFPGWLLRGDRRDPQWEAFCEGYGEMPSGHLYFRSYVLLRAMSRYPNRFEPQLKEIIQALL